MASLLRGLKYLPLTKSNNNFSKLFVISTKSIMTTRVRLEKVMEDLTKNPYFGKYAQKISELQQTNPEEFLNRVEMKEKEVREKKEKAAKEAKSFGQSSNPKTSLEPGFQKEKPKLNDIMKTEMIKDKTKEEIVQIWHEYHKQKNCISGVLDKNQYEKMFGRGRQYPTFLLPLPRDQGYEFIVIQFHANQVHMTPLLWYQTHKENAPECLTMTHYTEMMDTKDIVLMRGEFDTKSMNVQEAQCLANELQLYYSLENPARLKLLEKFTKKPDEFKHMDLIAQLETITFDTKVDGSKSDVEKKK